jgi:hypothetical protein
MACVLPTQCNDEQEERWAAAVLGDWLFLGCAKDAKNLLRLRQHQISTSFMYGSVERLWNSLRTSFGGLLPSRRMCTKRLLHQSSSLFPLAHILNVSDDVPNYFEAKDSHLSYLKLHVKDFGLDSGISRVFQQAFECAFYCSCRSFSPNSV